MVRWWWVSFSCEKGFLGAAIMTANRLMKLLQTRGNMESIQAVKRKALS